MKVIARIMARGIGSTLPRKNAFPILGKPMLWRFLNEMKKANFIDEIFVWTEDDELAKITNDCDCHVIPRPKEMIFYYGGFMPQPEWDSHIQKHIQAKCGTLGDVIVYLNCNYCLLTAEIMESMFEKLLKDPTASSIFPVTKIDPHLYMINHRTGYLFPVWEHQSLDKNNYPDLYRAGGIKIFHIQRHDSRPGLRAIHQVVSPEYLLDVDSVEDVKLAEYYLMKRFGGKVVVDEKAMDL